MANEIQENRDSLLGQYFDRLNTIVGHLAKGHEAARCNFRLADWGTLGLDISEALQGNKGRTEFQGCLDSMISAQHEFSLSEDPLCQALGVFLDEKRHISQNSIGGNSEPNKFKAGELFAILKSIADEHGFTWACQNSAVLGKELAQAGRDIGNLFNVEIRIEKGGGHQNTYSFVDREEGGEGGEIQQVS